MRSSPAVSAILTLSCLFPPLATADNLSEIVWGEIHASNWAEASLGGLDGRTEPRYFYWEHFEKAAAGATIPIYILTPLNTKATRVKEWLPPSILNTLGCAIRHGRQAPSTPVMETIDAYQARLTDRVGTVRLESGLKTVVLSSPHHRNTASYGGWRPGEPRPGICSERWIDVRSPNVPRAEEFDPLAALTSRPEVRPSPLFQAPSNDPKDRIARRFFPVELILGTGLLDPGVQFWPAEDQELLRTVGSGDFSKLETFVPEKRMAAHGLAAGLHADIVANLDNAQRAYAFTVPEGTLLLIQERFSEWNDASGPFWSDYRRSSQGRDKCAAFVSKWRLAMAKSLRESAVRALAQPSGANEIQNFSDLLGADSAAFVKVANNDPKETDSLKDPGIKTWPVAPIILPAPANNPADASNPQPLDPPPQSFEELQKSLEAVRSRTRKR